MPSLGSESDKKQYETQIDDPPLRDQEVYDMDKNKQNIINAMIMFGEQNNWIYR